MSIKQQHLLNHLNGDATLLNQLKRNGHCVFYHDWYHGEKFLVSKRNDGIYILCFRGSGSLPLSNHHIAEIVERSRFNGMFGPFN